MGDQLGSVDEGEKLVGDVREDGLAQRQIGHADAVDRLRTCVDLADPAGGCSDGRFCRSEND